MKRKIIKKDKVRLNLKSVKVYVLGGICAVLTVLCIYMTIESTTTGAEIASLQNKQAQMLSRQRELQEELVQALSVNKLQEQSSTYGFAKINDLVYVTDAAPVAKLP